MTKLLWLASGSGLGAITYFLIGALSDGEPVLIRAAWGAASGGAVLLIGWSHSAFGGK